MTATDTDKATENGLRNEVKAVVERTFDRNRIGTPRKPPKTIDEQILGEIKGLRRESDRGSRILAARLKRPLVSITAASILLMTWQTMAVARWNGSIAAELVLRSDPIASVFSFVFRWRVPLSVLALSKITVGMGWKAAAFSEFGEGLATRLASVVEKILPRNWDDDSWHRRDTALLLALPLSVLVCLAIPLAVGAGIVWQAFGRADKWGIRDEWWVVVWLPAVAGVGAYFVARVKEYLLELNKDKDAMGKIPLRHFLVISVWYCFIGMLTVSPIWTSIAEEADDLIASDTPWHPVQKISFQDGEDSTIELVGAVIGSDDQSIIVLTLEPREIRYVGTAVIRSRALCDSSGNHCGEQSEPRSDVNS